MSISDRLKIFLFKIWGIVITTFVFEMDVQVDVFRKKYDLAITVKIQQYWIKIVKIFEVSTIKRQAKVQLK